MLEPSIERTQQKVTRLCDRGRAVALAQRVVIEAVKNVTLLDRRAQSLEEPVLRGVMDNPVGA